MVIATNYLPKQRKSMNFAYRGHNVRLTPWPGEDESCLISSKFGQALPVEDRNFIQYVKVVAKSMEYEKLLWQSASLDSDAMFARTGFELRDQLHILISWDTKTPFPRLGSEERISIRRARAMDIERVLEIDHLCFEPFWQLDSQGIEEANLATPRSRYRIAIDTLDSREPIGYAIFGQGNSAGYLQRIAVDPQYQGKGVATALIQDGFQWLRRWRVHKVSVNTQTKNTKALNLYLGLGFKLQREGLSLYQCQSE